jgi:hypothetical protein
MKKLILFVTLFCCYSCMATDTTSLYNYRNKILSIYNQCILLDNNVSEAIKTKSPEEIERARINLLNYTGVGMKQLDSIGNYEDDAALKFSCRDVLNFYKQMTESDISQLRDFFIVEQNFLAVKKAFNKKPVKRHSESEIIAYNSEANKYNQAVTRYMEVSRFIESSRKHTLYNWTSSVKLFMDSHKS